MNFQQDQKGLFTFYRQQQAIQDQVKLKKKQLKLQKQREKEEKERLERQAIQKQRQMREQKQQQLRRHLEKIKTQRKLLFQPRHKEQKYEKKKLGQSVLIVENKKKPFHKKSETDPMRNKSFSKMSEQKNSGYFLQNKQLPFAFGQVSSLQKMMINQEQAKFTPVPVHYYNRYSEVQDQKYIPSFSYEKLPQASKKKRSETVFPKLQKSKRIEILLKSGESQILKKMKENMKEEHERQQQISYINYSQNEYEEKPKPKLNERQRKIIEVLKRSRKNYE